MRDATQLSPAGPVKILILKPSSLGDVVQALPVLRRLKAHWPHSRIYWWVESRLAGLLEGDKDLAGLVIFERKRWAAPRNWWRLARSVLWMRRQHFDWVIDLQCLARSAAIAWLANGATVVGLDERREGARAFYDVTVPRGSFYTHAVDWYLGVLPALGVPADGPFEWLPPRADVADALERKWPRGEHRWLIVQPGARWLNKRWPLELFAEFIRTLAAERPEVRFAILGGAEDMALGERLRQAAPERCLDLTGRLSLPEMVEWIRRSELMVSNDTGPMHVAAALGRPVVALFGPTEPRRTGPYGQLTQILQLELPCVPCLKKRCRFIHPLECLRALPLSALLDAVRSRLSHPSAASSRSIGRLHQHVSDKNLSPSCLSL
jgi:lipopolysaccharide heptosyltransferase I